MNVSYENRIRTAGTNLRERKISDFRDRLKGAPILADGGMGTELYSRGVYVNQCFDELNISRPDLISSVHADYISAGAELIETNTFGANRFKLAPHGLAEKVGLINRSGAEIACHAREKSGKRIYIAGSIGPLGRRLAPLGTIRIKEAREAFAEQAKGLVDGGVDLISVETMVDPVELKTAIKAVRDVTDIPLVACVTLTDWSEETYNPILRRLTSDLTKLDVDVLGINCSLGPNKLLEAAKLLFEMTNLPIAIQPNAGELEWIEGRLICRTTPEYFAEYSKRMALSGVRIIGGYCGTTPDHIRSMSAALRAVSPELSEVSAAIDVPVVKHELPEIEEIPYEELSSLSADLAVGKFVFCVEINPPRSPGVKSIVEKVRTLRENGVKYINVPDGPRASARLSAMVLTHILKRETDVDPILHYTCRDRNILGIQSDLLGAEALGLDNILCVTGDPPKLGDYPMATAVFDVDAIGLLKITDNLNHKLDLAGNPIPKRTTFHLGCGANPGAIDLELEIDRLHRKVENGARFIMTQPVFDVELFFKFLDKINLRKIPVLVGILPLASYRNAEFFHNEVPGMQVPEFIREKLQKVDDREASARIGIEIAAEALISTAQRAAGAYIMPPFGRIDLALGVIDLFKQSSIGTQKLGESD